MPNIVKNTTHPNLLDLIAPHSCRGCGHMGSLLCSRCKKNIVNHYLNYCPFCKTPSLDCSCHSDNNFPPTYIISRRNSLTHQLVQDLKYHSARNAAKQLAEILNSVLPTFERRLIVVPLPTIGPHIRKRGLDHTLSIAKHLVNLRKPAEVSKILLRANKTTQVGSNRQERLSQAKEAYSFNQKATIKKDAVYLLFDDVWTTGASIQSAVKILQNNNIKNIAIAILSLS